MNNTLRQSGTLLGFAAIIVLFAIQLPDTFLSARNLINITLEVSCAGRYRVCRSAVGSGVGVYRSGSAERINIPGKCVPCICAWRSG